MAIEDELKKMVEAEVARQLAAARPANDVAPPMLVTIAAYAAARSISTSTVRAAIREGRLEALKIGRATRVRATDELARPVRPVRDPGRRAAVARILKLQSVP